MTSKIFKSVNNHVKGFFCVGFLIIATQAFSECTFKTGDFVSDLKNSRNIDLIEIETPKSARYVRNLYKTIVSETENIPPKLKKKFKAKITIHYKFGKCVFEGSIRQHGDWKDHISFSEGGTPVRSLNVKLKNGNLLSAVEFKLLLPETRGGANEILTTLILRYMGIISPETFSVVTKVNGIQSVMLFQENARKELLERNNRRESAIFEGDEKLLWSFKDYDNFELEPLALSRMTNRNWFLKGSSSSTIALSSFSSLQKSYLRYSQDIEGHETLVMYPGSSYHDFAEYAFLLTAMNAWHALRPHNRKFYYNMIKKKFEPIYYDGNASFTSIEQKMHGRLRSEVIKKLFSKGLNQGFTSKLEALFLSEKILLGFLDRANNLEINAKDFYQNAWQEFSRNIKILKDEIAQIENNFSIQNSLELNSQYIKRMHMFNVDQIIYVKIEKNRKHFIGTLDNGLTNILSAEETARLISNNEYNGKRAVFIGDFIQDTDMTLKKFKHKSLDGEIVMSRGLKVAVGLEEKSIFFEQTQKTDWALLKGINLTNWKIVFNGVQTKNQLVPKEEERFNIHGITGCLTIYNSFLNNTDLEVSGGRCEDSLNIISSTGEARNVKIIRAFSDAIDVDFSSIIIDHIVVEGAGNDCYDVSGGDYAIKSALFKRCGDKAISVGEGSILSVQDLYIDKANIGVSSKDLSSVNILAGDIKNVSTCLEAKQKKQEFGGAQIKNKNLVCDGPNQIESNSVLLAATP